MYKILLKKLFHKTWKFNLILIVSNTQKIFFTFLLYNFFIFLCYVISTLHLSLKNVFWSRRIRFYLFCMKLNYFLKKLFLFDKSCRYRIWVQKEEPSDHIIFADWKILYNYFISRMVDYLLFFLFKKHTKQKKMEVTKIINDLILRECPKYKLVVILSILCICAEDVII